MELHHMWTDQKWVLVTLKKPWASLAPASYWISWFFSTHYLFFRFQLIFWALLKAFPFSGQLWIISFRSGKASFHQWVVEAIVNIKLFMVFFFFFLTWAQLFPYMRWCLHSSINSGVPQMVRCVKAVILEAFITFI